MDGWGIQDYEYGIGALTSWTYYYIPFVVLLARRLIGVLYLERCTIGR